MKTKVNLKFLLPLLAFVFSVGWATAHASPSERGQGGGISQVSQAWIYSSPIKLEHKEGYKLDNSEYKAAVSTPTSFGSSGMGLSAFTGYLWKVMAVLGLVGLLFKQVKRKDLMIGASLFIAAVAISFICNSPEGFVLANAVPVIIKGKDPKDMSLREARDGAMKILNQMQDVYREKREGKEIPADKEAQFDAWDKELLVFEQEIRFKERQELLDGVEVRKGPKVPGTDIDTTEEKYDPNFQPKEKEVRMAIAKLNKRGYEKLTSTEKKIANLVELEERAWITGLSAGFDPNRMDAETRSILDSREKRNPEQRAQTVTTTGGGYLIPEGFMAEVIKYLKYISPFFDEFKATPSAEAQSLFNFRRTNSGANIPWPSYDDTSNTGELLAINTTIGSATNMVFSRIVLSAFKYSSKPILVPYELFEDDGVGINGLVTETLATRIGRIGNTHLTTGDDSGKPQGIVTGAGAGKVTASSSAVTFGEILDLEHSVDPSYRKRPTCRFMFNDQILLALKKLTVGTSTNNARPLWQPGWDVGAPPTIDGFQYVINQDMASSQTSGAKIMLFGDMKAYAVRLVNDVRAYKLEERYRDLDQTGFISFIRMDGRTLNTSAIKYLRNT